MTPHSPELPGDITRWPGYPLEYLICQNRSQRAAAVEVGNIMRFAEISQERTRIWWRVSMAREWPTGGKWAEAKRAGIEPALLALQRLKARLKVTDDGGAIIAPSTASPDELDAALGALGLAHLERRSTEAGAVAA
ncbi:MAG: hypothetical protein FJW36_25300 [Acidobacteria bacterium]|nr:hypothetical protein [Acidobacteriota bacterium]